MLAASYLLLASSSLSLTIGYGFMRQAKKAYNVFKYVIDTSTYSFDYIQGAYELVPRQQVALAAHLLNKDSSALKEKLGVQSICFLPGYVYYAPPRTENNDDEYDESSNSFFYTQVSTQLPQALHIQNSKGEQIELVFNHKDPILLFNIEQLRDNQNIKELKDSNGQKSDNQPDKQNTFMPRKFWKQGENAEFYLDLKKQYVFLGKVKNGPTSGTYLLETKAILGENRDFLLKFLDSHIMYNFRIGRNFLAIGLILLAIQYMLSKAIRAQKMFSEENKIASREQ